MKLAFIEYSLNCILFSVVQSAVFSWARSGHLPKVMTVLQHTCTQFTTNYNSEQDCDRPTRYVAPSFAVLYEIKDIYIKLTHTYQELLDIIACLCLCFRHTFQISQYDISVGSTVDMLNKISPLKHFEALLCLVPVLCPAVYIIFPFFICQIHEYFWYFFHCNV